MIKEKVCRCCKGTGEEMVEEGSVWNPPLYEECSLCNGSGLEKQLMIKGYLLEEI